MIKIGLIGFLAVWLAALAVSAQDAPEATSEPIEGLVEVGFSADRLSPLIGEPISLTLTADIPSNLEIAEWPEINGSWGDFMVHEVGESENHEQFDGSVIQQQEFTIILWEPGDYQTPTTFIGYRMLNSDEIFRIPVKPIFFTVPSVLDPDDMELRPARAPISLFYLPPWIVVLGLGVLVAMGWVGYRWYERQHLARLQRRLLNLKTPGQMVLEGLAELKNSELTPQDICAEMADNLRFYIWQKYGVPAPDMTTTELFSVLNIAAQNGHWTDVQRLLEQADLVKFAQLQPSEQIVVRMLNLAYRWVSSLEATAALEAQEIGTGREGQT
jgi:hypothetical protein